MQDILNDKKKVIIASSILLIVLIVLAFTLSYFQSIKKASNPQSQQSELEKVETETGGKAVPLYPKVTVKNWTESKEASPTTSSTSAQVYSFKQNYSADEIKSLATNTFGMEEIIAEGTQTLGYALGEGKEDISAFVFQNRTGEFSYESNAGISYSGSSASEKAQNLVQNIFKDPTIQFFASYKDIKESSVTLFEFHRNWQATELPILNALGIFNIKQNVPLSSLKLGDPRFAPQDSNILSTSDNTNGLARSSDFSTITIGVNDKSGNIVSIISNMRMFDQKNPATNVNLKTYKKALDELKANKYEFLYTAPSGEGVPSYDKVYPGGRASTANAVITDSIITYLEDNIAEIQNTLEPYYLFKGTTKLNSGYNVDFIAAVKAGAK